MWGETGNNSLNSNISLQLDLFFKRKGKLSKIPYVQVFMIFYQKSYLSNGPRNRTLKQNPMQETDTIEGPLPTPGCLSRRYRFFPICLMKENTLGGLLNLLFIIHRPVH